MQQSTDKSKQHENVAKETVKEEQKRSQRLLNNQKSAG